MLPMNDQVVLIRATGEGPQRDDVRCAVLPESILFPVTTDVVVGDQVEELLPNRNLRTLRVTEVVVHRSPLPGSNPGLNHIQASYEEVRVESATARQPADPSVDRWRCRVAIVAMLHARRAVGSSSRAVSWDVVVDSMLAGGLAADDVVFAGEWLYTNGFVEGPAMAERTVPVSVWLTARGLECAEDFGGDVRQFLKANAGSRPTQTFQISGGVVQLATGDRSK